MLTAVLLVPLVVLMLYGGIAAVIAGAVIGLIMSWEISSMLFAGRRFLQTGYCLLLVAPFVVMEFGVAAAYPMLAVITALLLLGLVHGSWIAALVSSALGVALVSLGQVLADPQRLTYLLVLVIAITATDSAAYFGGRYFGGPKMAVKISPSKTWSGAVCGLAGAMLAVTILALLLDAPLLSMLGYGIVLSIASMIGDLLESALKRHHDVKDSGNLLGHHGGLLDRFDGYLIALPVLAALLLIDFSHG